MGEKIFISYKRVNYNQVKDLVGRIEAGVGEKCWVDIDGIKSNAQFASVICRALDDCSVVLFMYSEAHLSIDFDNDWTVKELRYAEAKNKKVILVKLDDAKLDNIFLLDFGSKNNIDSRSEIQVKKLIKDLNSMLHPASQGAKTKEDSNELPKKENSKKTPRKKPASPSASQQKKDTLKSECVKKLHITNGSCNVYLLHVGDKTETCSFLATLPSITPDLAADYIRLAPLFIIRGISEESARQIIDRIDALGGSATIEKDRIQPMPNPTPVRSTKQKTSKSSAPRSSGKTGYTVVLESLGSGIGRIALILRALSHFGIALSKSHLSLLPFNIAHNISYDKAVIIKNSLELLGAEVTIKRS